MSNCTITMWWSVVGVLATVLWRADTGVLAGVVRGKGGRHQAYCQARSELTDRVLILEQGRECKSDGTSKIPNYMQDVCGC